MTMTGNLIKKNFHVDELKCGVYPNWFRINLSRNLFLISASIFTRRKKKCSKIYTSNVIKLILRKILPVEWRPTIKIIIYPKKKRKKKIKYLAHLVFDQIVWLLFNKLVNLFSMTFTTHFAIFFCISKWTNTIHIWIFDIHKRISENNLFVNRKIPLSIENKEENILLVFRLSHEIY